MSPTISTPATLPAWPFANLYNGGASYRESIPRLNVNSVTVALQTTGIMTLVGVPALAGDVITSITVRWGSTGSATPTNWWFALYDTAATPSLIGQTADQLTTVVSAAGTTSTIALVGGPFTLAATGLHYVGILFAGTVPTCSGASATGLGTIQGGIATLPLQKRLAASNGSGLTTTAPAGPITLASNVLGVPYVVLS